MRRINYIEEKIVLGFQKKKQRAEDIRIDENMQNTKSSKFLEAQPEEEEKHDGPDPNDEYHDQPEGQGNSFIEQVVRENQLPAINYKEEVESINQILSREIEGMVNKQPEQEYQDDENKVKENPVEIQNDWSKDEQPLVSDSDSQ